MSSKSLETRRLSTYAGWEIYFDGGGVLPAPLTGMFTSQNAAEQAIASYQAGVRAKVSKRGKSQSK